MENSGNQAQRQSNNANTTNSDNTLDNTSNIGRSSNQSVVRTESDTRLNNTTYNDSTMTTSTSREDTAASEATTIAAPMPVIDSSVRPDSTANTTGPASTDTGAAHEPQGNGFWCHQASFCIFNTYKRCQREITPMMVPDPMCPHCHGEFVEKIEADNDPRTFAQSAPQHTASGHDASGEQASSEFNEPVNLEDLFRLFQALANPHRTMQHQQQQQQQQQQRRPGQVYSTQFTFHSGPMTTTRTFSSPGMTTLNQQQQSARDHIAPSTGTTGLGAQTGQGTQTGHGAQTGQTGQSQGTPAPQWHSPPAFISGLLNRLGIELHYTTDPAALSGQGFAGPLGGGGVGGPMGNPFLPIFGNPGDYAWGQGALDDIITQMMELQNRQHGPVGATEEVINHIPHHTLTDEELVDIPW
ncbi:hypothetical protein BGX28_006405 [Mortierella sp. GBA30]|nr:hypothetical protein BGX28_006405 [Mortierella sp. GBA30]